MPSPIRCARWTPCIGSIANAPGSARARPALRLGNARAQVQHLVGDEFIQRVWTSDEGLPGNSVTSLLHTAGGFLWVGTFGGLARFDGVRFPQFDVRNTPALRSDRITALIPDGKNGFWIVSEQDDLARFDGTSFTSYDKRGGAPIDKVTVGFLGRDGEYWIAGERSIFHLSTTGVVHRYDTADGVPAEEVRQIERDDAGTHLFATGKGLFVLRKKLNTNRTRRGFDCRRDCCRHAARRKRWHVDHH